MFWRMAASSTVSPGATWKVWPLGSSRTWWPVAGGSANLGCCLASAAEFAFDQVAVHRSANDGFGDDARAGEEQQGERDQVGDHAGKDEQQAGEHRAGAVREGGDG